MAYDEGLAQLMRDDLTDEPGITETKMFGGLCFLRNGHMVCGLYKGAGMFRVGKDATDAALKTPGTSQMMMTGRAMPGMVDATAEVIADDAKRAHLLAMSLAHARSLPPKVAKPKKPR